jgi:hypothetical protein
MARKFQRYVAPMTRLLWATSTRLWCKSAGRRIIPELLRSTSPQCVLAGGQMIKSATGSLLSITTPPSTGQG